MRTVNLIPLRTLFVRRKMYTKNVGLNIVVKMEWN